MVRPYLLNALFFSLVFPIYISSYFEFRLCPIATAKQDCLDKNLLQLMSGVPSVPQPNDLTTRFYPRNGSRIYEIKALLPEGKLFIILMRIYLWYMVCIKSSMDDQISRYVCIINKT